jgi:hypothetical protein
MGAAIAKLIYSAIIVGLIAVLAREFWKVWFDNQVYIGRFDVVSETGRDEEASAAFPKRIVSAQAILAQQIKDYQTRAATGAPTDLTYILPGDTPLSLPPETLQGVEITIQSVNLSQILTAARRMFLAPNEVRGNVTLRETSVLAAVDWPRAPQPNGDRSLLTTVLTPNRLRGDRPPLTQFLTPSKPSAQEAAAYIACSLTWARATSVEDQLATVPRGQFCDFAAGLGDLYALSDKASTPDGLSTEEAALVRKRVSQLKAHYSSGSVFPELYRLRADLLDLLSEALRTRSELVEAQEDRIRYAMLSPGLRQLSGETKRMAAQAIARPALILENGKVSAPPDNWAGLLRRYEPDIQAVSASTGLVLGANGNVAGTGFMVAPGLMMTAVHVLDYARGSKAGASVPSGQPRLCFGSNSTDCERALVIGDTIYNGKAGGSTIVLANVDGHDLALEPPLPLLQPLPQPNELTGRYVYVVGYPFPDYRMPPEFISRLLGKEGGQKRLMPGRILAFGPGQVSGGLEQAAAALPVVTTDISTSGGTAGGPLVDFSTGQVIGTSYGGIWRGERGKFAYAHTMPKEVVDIVTRRLSGEADATNKPAAEGGAPANQTPARQ